MASREPTVNTYWRTVGALMAVGTLAFWAFCAVTHGFEAVTSDGARRAKIAGAPRALPAITLVDAEGQSLSLADYGSRSGRVTFVTLVYVQCQDVCLTSAAGQSWLQAQIDARGLGDKVRLLTLSFDPRRDTPAVLANQAGKMGARAPSWRFATVQDPGTLRALLDLFEVVVLPDGLGGYAHNAALFLIDENGRLARAYDIDRPDLALADYLRTRGSL